MGSTGAGGGNGSPGYAKLSFLLELPDPTIPIFQITDPTNNSAFSWVDPSSWVKTMTYGGNGTPYTINIPTEMKYIGFLYASAGGSSGSNIRSGDSGNSGAYIANSFLNISDYNNATLTMNVPLATGGNGGPLTIALNGSTLFNLGGGTDSPGVVIKTVDPSNTFNGSGTTNPKNGQNTTYGDGGANRSDGQQGGVIMEVYENFSQLPSNAVPILI